MGEPLLVDIGQNLVLSQQAKEKEIEGLAHCTSLKGNICPEGNMDLAGTTLPFPSIHVLRCISS